MSWICPSCGGDNEHDELRCTCGLERESPDPKHKTKAEIEGDKAQLAMNAGAKIYQLILPLSTTRGGVAPMMGVFTTSETTEHTSILESIEEHGWHLEFVNYVYRMTKTESRDKFLSSGQQEAVSGEVLGIYLFRIPSYNQRT